MSHSISTPVPQRSWQTLTDFPQLLSVLLVSYILSELCLAMPHQQRSEKTHRWLSLIMVDAPGIGLINRQSLLINNWSAPLVLSLSQCLTCGVSQSSLLTLILAWWCPCLVSCYTHWDMRNVRTRGQKWVLHLSWLSRVDMRMRRNDDKHCDSERAAVQIFSSPLESVNVQT